MDESKLLEPVITSRYEAFGKMEEIRASLSERERHAVGGMNDSEGKEGAAAPLRPRGLSRKSPQAAQLNPVRAPPRSPVASNQALTPPRSRRKQGLSPKTKAIAMRHDRSGSLLSSMVSISTSVDSDVETTDSEASSYRPKHRRVSVLQDDIEPDTTQARFKTAIESIEAQRANKSRRKRRLRSSLARGENPELFTKVRPARPPRSPVSARARDSPSRLRRDASRLIRRVTDGQTSREGKSADETSPYSSGTEDPTTISPITFSRPFRPPENRSRAPSGVSSVGGNRARATSTASKHGDLPGLAGRSSMDVHDRSLAQSKDQLISLDDARTLVLPDVKHMSFSVATRVAQMIKLMKRRQRKGRTESIDASVADARSAVAAAVASQPRMNPHLELGEAFMRGPPKHWGSRAATRSLSTTSDPDSSPCTPRTPQRPYSLWGSDPSLSPKRGTALQPFTLRPSLTSLDDDLSSGRRPPTIITPVKLAAPVKSAGPGKSTGPGSEPPTATNPTTTTSQERVRKRLQKILTLKLDAPPSPRREHDRVELDPSTPAHIRERMHMFEAQLDAVLDKPLSP